MDPDASAVISGGEQFSSMNLLPNRELEALSGAGYYTPVELLMRVPKRYEDRRRFDSFPNQPTSKAVSLRGKVIDSTRRRFGKGRGFYEAVIMDESGGVFGSGNITCRWFNMQFIHKLVAAGQDVIVYGKVKDAKGRLMMDQPEFEVVREDEDIANSVHLDRIVPIYRNISGISQRRLRELMHMLVTQVSPESVELGFDVGDGRSRFQALKDVHFPDSLDDAQAARRRFALEEFFMIQLNVAWRKLRHSKRNGRAQGKKTTLLKEFYHGLPFDLTGAQKRAIREIIGDMREPIPMNRLLQGDVGAGKTFVAMAAMVLAVDSGAQAALMAPTQILAEQHYLTFRRWLEPLGIRVALKTSHRSEATGLELSGAPQIVIGTHALLYDDELFEDLGLVVIDEQHKFGVAQRESLVRLGVVPDVLVMTATPIPRTLTMTVYGDLDVSLLDEKPAGRGKIITGVRAKPKQADINRFIKEQLGEGRQAYLVYPLVEESESLKVESATEAFKKWQKRLSGYDVGLVHGKLRPEEKERVMKQFRDGEIHALVCTTVIEVGVDVPNANVMILHHAERFGLAQLHQLRGRIGRGEHKSYCVLLTDGKNPEALDKLSVLENSSDGFVIAEEDLKIRGPGDVLGTAQSGMSDIQFAEFLTDTALLKEARAMADGILADDPTLDGQHQTLKSLIQDGELDKSH